MVSEERDGQTLILNVRDAAIFTNYLGLSKRLKAVDDSVKCVIINFEDAFVVDHTVLDKLHGIANRWTERELLISGLDDHAAMSDHHLAARRRVREGALA